VVKTVSALGASDPVALHEAHLLGPVDGVEVRDQAVGVCGDPHHPLAQVPLEHRVVATLGAAVVGDLLVGQHGAQAGTPVHRGLGDVGEAERVEDGRPLHGRELGPRAAAGHLARARLELGHQLRDWARPARSAAASGRLRVVPRLEDPREDPLGPPHVVRVRGGEAAAVVVGEAETAQLAAHRPDVLLGRHPGMLPRLDGVLLRRQAEGVIPQGVQHVPAAHPFEAAHHVRGDIAEGVSDVEALPGRVGEHVQQVELLPCRPRPGERPPRVVGVEGSLLLPAILPGRLDPLGQGGGVAEGGNGVLGHAVLLGAPGMKKPPVRGGSAARLARLAKEQSGHVRMLPHRVVATPAPSAGHARTA